MSSPAERIAWLAALSAERRAMRRRSNCSAETAIIWQTSKKYDRWVGDIRAEKAATIRVRSFGFEFAPRTPKLLSPVVPPISSRQLTRIVKIQGNRCYLCDRPMSAPTREHVTPKSLGGRNARNVLAAHQRCNVDKASRPPRPCEMLYLEAVYLRLGAPERNLSPSQPESVSCS